MLTVVSAQAQSIGIRAGLNYATFSGELEENETYGFSNGFHFGINYGYKFSDYFMLRGEVVYTQIGSTQQYDGKGYYRIYGPQKTYYEVGQSEINLDISNAYIAVPITAVGQLGKKIEVFGGGYFSFLVNPIAGGTHKFGSYDNPDDVGFLQSLNYNYYDDKAKEGQTFVRPIIVRKDDNLIEIVENAGAYYQSETKQGSKFNWFDAGLTVGANYFINKGFYFGGRLNYGLLDITRREMDPSLVELNSDSSSKLRDDRDNNLAIEVSLGFRF